MRIKLKNELKKFVVPTEIRNLSITKDRILTPGTRIPFNENKIKLFIAWHSNNKQEADIDIDLSAGLIKENDGIFKMEPISFYNLESGGAQHSGDFTSCIAFTDNLITAEYIDLDIEILKEKYNYIVITEMIYSGAEDFNDVKCYAGVQSGTKTPEETIDLSKYLFKMELTGEFQSHSSIAIDLKTKEIVILDQYSKENYGITINSLARKVQSHKDLFYNAYLRKENMYNFLIMYCEAKGYEIVETDEDLVVGFLEDCEFDVSKNLTKILDILT